MKKIYFLALSALIATTVSAQQITETFESFNLNGSQFINNSQPEQWFIGNQMKFSNDYNSEFLYWTGFAISKVQDITTPGYDNMYASFTNGGENSTNYGVFYSTGKIEFNSSVTLKEFSITNTTYAALSMRDGDQYAKKFGSVNNSAGVPDGTDGKDFLYVRVKFYDETNQALNYEKDIYLADFRFDNNAEDYILDTWKKIEFNEPQLENKLISSIEFSINSSDIGEFGMNTPAYFAIDNIKVEVPTNAVNSIAMNAFTIYPNPATNKINIIGEMNQWILTDLTGKEIANGTQNEISIENLTSGVYQLIIKSDVNTSVKRFQKL